MLLHEAFFCLKIPVTKDSAVIKAAYRKLLPLHHPEEDPQGFMQLHEAYRTALSYAKPSPSSPPTFRKSDQPPQKDTPVQNTTGYDHLFGTLDDTATKDLSLEKKAFSRRLQRLRLHWLPIPLKTWASFFGSEAFLCCCTDPECMEKLLELLSAKIHTYSVFLFLTSRLWETENLQRNEGLEVLANKTRTCIRDLQEQYRHYLRLDPAARFTRWLLSVAWYYQAIPFCLKMAAGTFLIPLLSFGNGDLFINLLLGFYIVESYIFFKKMARGLGVFYPTVWKKSWAQRFNIRGNTGLLITVGIYTLLFHLFLCAGVWENLYGW